MRIRRENEPVFVKTYGPVILFIKALILVILTAAVVPLIEIPNSSNWMPCILLIVGLVTFIVCLFLIGKGLRKGEKVAVYGLCFVFLVGLVAPIFSADVGCMLIIWGVFLLFDVPLIAVALKNWNCFY